jgi:hypothetical protein
MCQRCCGDRLATAGSPRGLSERDRKALHLFNRNPVDLRRLIFVSEGYLVSSDNSLARAAPADGWNVVIRIGHKTRLNSDHSITGAVCVR